MRDPRLLAKPPVCRLGCLVLLRDPRGRVLLIDPDFMDGLILPGGSARANESPHEAAARHLHAETGLNRRPTHLLAVDFTPADRYLERLNLVFDGGTLSDHEAARITVPPQHRSGLLGHRFVDPRRLPTVMSPAQAARVREALTTAPRRFPLLLHGQRAA
ncbi:MULTISPECIES: NUDIX domain-containing protein [unclassified Kitasatospora]|uniref:NUDIX domain-containing protein n=1 Tax=unclassified Kitasatospora TaxID=2633591 RepID=UPI003829DF89